MNQVRKFYLASFLKNQTYFVPILVIFFQDFGLDYAQIFWVLTGGSVFSFLLEIPTGVFADLYGKQKSIIISKFGIFLSFVAFGFANGFWTLLLANLLYELGKSFRSGTETAFVYDYLEQNPKTLSYTKLKAKQKFYARLSESIATAFGGYAASQFGFSSVFFFASIPAFINAAQTLTWEHVKEFNGGKGVKASFYFVKEAMLFLKERKSLLKLMFNVLLYSSVFVALGTFVQPYMKEAGLPLEYFGFVYSGFLLLAAFLTRFSSDLEERFGGVKVMNMLTALSAIPIFILGSGYVSYIGIGLFFLVLLVQNLRSPIENTIFHGAVDSSNRSTMGSMLALFKNSGNLVILPAMGYIADSSSIYSAILLLGVIVFITAVFFRVQPKQV